MHSVGGKSTAIIINAVVINTGITELSEDKQILSI
jgi:hypothetical protein